MQKIDRNINSNTELINSNTTFKDSLLGSVGRILRRTFTTAIIFSLFLNMSGSLERSGSNNFGQTTLLPQNNTLSLDDSSSCMNSKGPGYAPSEAEIAFLLSDCSNPSQK